MCAAHGTRHLPNVLGALGLGIADDIEAVVAEVAGTPLSVPAAVSVVGTWGAGSSVDELARALGVTHSRAVRVADRLEAEGLIERERSAADGRQVLLQPTREGRFRAGSVHGEREEAIERWLAPLDADERETLSALVDKMLEARAAQLDANHTCRLCDAKRCGHPDGCPVTRGSA